jgi:hypothetical protein
VIEVTNNWLWIECIDRSIAVMSDDRMHLYYPRPQTVVDCWRER